MIRPLLRAAGLLVVLGTIAITALAMPIRDGVTIEACTVDAGYPVVTVRIHNGDEELERFIAVDVLLAGQPVHRSVQTGPGQTLHWRLSGERPGPAECELMADGRGGDAPDSR